MSKRVEDRLEAMARIGLFGGTFDPIHHGHLILAELCREQLRLDRLEFVVAADPPHKPDGALASFTHRATMVRLALDGSDGLAVNESEATRAGPSYTVDTLRQRLADAPNDDLWFLVGADSLRDLPSWREPEAIIRLVRLAVVARPGVAIGREAIPESVPGLRERVDWVEAPLIELSSTVLRDRVQRGCTIRFQVPRAVESYIAAKGLYRDGTAVLVDPV
jgi:nicotinate-nucleotide adenylyltransferase